MTARVFCVLLWLSGSPALGEIRAIRAAGPVQVDGQLTENSWKQTSFLSNFRQQLPVSGAPPSVRTQVAILYDDKHLYIGARMDSSETVPPETALTLRDGGDDAERFIVSIDPFNTKNTATSFAVTAAGVQLDWFHREDSQGNRDYSFDAVWYSAVSHYRWGWTAEIKIPFSQLRYPNTEVQSWGINFNRFIPSVTEDLFWKVVPRGEEGWSSYFGSLTGLQPPRQDATLEIIPYVTTIFPIHEQNGAKSPELRGGTDIKVGVGPHTTIDATFFPDFGQVEVDPAVLNLSDSENIFEEKRPFFVKGQELLLGEGLPSFFYSRRIGELPFGSRLFPGTRPPSQGVPILAAAKLATRTPSWTLSSLAALTDKVTAVDALGNRVKLAPLSLFGVNRFQKNIGDSHLSGFTTFVHRSKLDEQEDYVPHTGGSLGTDFKIRLNENRYQLSGNFIATGIWGSEQAISRRENSSIHYFSRPDRTHVESSGSTSLTGWLSTVRGEKRSGAFRWSALAAAETPGVDLNETGQQFAADELAVVGDASYEWNRPETNLVRSFKLGGVVTQAWDFGGVRSPTQLDISSNVSFRNFWSVNMNGTLWSKGDHARLSRGGPVTRVPGGGSIGAGFNSNFGQNPRLGAYASLTDAPTFKGLGTTLSISGRPHPSLLLDFSPYFETGTNAHQYVTVLDDPQAPRYERRWLFGELDYKQLTLPVRIRWALTPTLSVNGYMQLFVSTGNYLGFKELVGGQAGLPRPLAVNRLTEGQYEASTREGTVVGFAASDFSSASFRSTFVLRWEFRPGSSLLVAWQQRRSASEARTQQFFTETRALAARIGEHALALKLSYWWN